MRPSTVGDAVFRRHWIAVAAPLLVLAGLALYRSGGATSEDHVPDERSIAVAPTESPSGLATRPPPLAGAKSEDPPELRPSAPDLGRRSVRVRGLVTLESGVPAAGATVQIVVQRGDETLERLTTTTRDDGTYGADLRKVSALDEDERDAYSISVTATLPGRRPAEPFERPLEIQDGEIRADVRFVAGGPRSILGRVLDAQGSPVANVWVEAFAGAGSAARDTTESDGRFGLSVRMPGVDAVWAVDPTRGRARWEPEDLPVTADWDVGDLTLRPSGIIEGRVELPDGSVPPSLTIAATRLDVGAEAASVPELVGARATYVKSAADGAFAFRALTPGRYRVEPLGEPPGDGRRPSTEVPTDSRGVVVVSHQRFYVIHVVDADGKDVEHVSCGFEEARDDPENGWCGGGDFGGGGSTQIFTIHVPRRLRVEVSTWTMDADLLTVDMPVDRWLVKATAVVRPRVPSGTIRIEAVDERGRSIDSYRAEARRLVDEGVARMMRTENWGWPGRPTSGGLRPGRYAVEVTPGAEVEPGRPCFGRQRVEAVVPSGGEVVARVVARPGGWLRANVVACDGRDGVAFRHRILRVGRETASSITSTWSDPLTPGTVHALQSGSPQFCREPLEPGDYVLAVSVPGEPDESRTPFSIRAGQTTDVEVRLEPAATGRPK